MLQKGPQEDRPQTYEQTRQLANQLAGGRGPVIRGELASSGRSDSTGQQRPSQDYRNQPESQQQRQPQNRPEFQRKMDWAKEEPDEEDEIRGQEMLNLYSTPLDLKHISPEKQAEAERIANEIERATGGGDRYEGYNNYRRGGGKGNTCKPGGGSFQGSRRWDNDRYNDRGEGGKSKGKSKNKSYSQQPQQYSSTSHSNTQDQSHTQMSSNRLNW